MATVDLPNIREPFIDPRTNQISRAWWIWLQQLMTRIGGSDGTDITALQAAVTALIALTTAQGLQIDGFVPLPPDLDEYADDGMSYAAPAGYGKLEDSLAQFAETTSAQLAGVMTDETGSGALVFGTNPTINGASLTGGSANNQSIGATTPAAGTFTTLRGNSLAKVIMDSPTSQTVPNNTVTQVTNWTSQLNNGSHFNATTGVFTAPRAGQYLVCAEITFGTTTFAAANQEATVVLHKNGAQARSARALVSAACTLVPSSPHMAVLVDLAASDTLDIRAYQNGGASSSTAANINTFLTITELP